MKKLIICAIAFMTVLAFSACNKEKDGVYKPDKKISKVYYSSESEKYLTEHWHWKKGKVSSIDYYNMSGSINYTFNFEYNGTRLEKVVLADEVDYYFKFSYDGKYLSKIEIYYEGILVEGGTVTHENNKITEIAWELQDGKSYSDKSEKSKRFLKMKTTAMQLLFPDIDREYCLQKIIQKNNAKAEKYNITEKFKWNGNNIIEFALEDETGKDVLKLQYDNKKNPFCGYYGYYGSAGIGIYGGILYPHVIFSENNLVCEYNAQTPDKKIEYEYKYDGDWPIEKKSRSEYYSYTYYYEYE